MELRSLHLRLHLHRRRSHLYLLALHVLLYRIDLLLHGLLLRLMLLLLYRTRDRGLGLRRGSPHRSAADRGKPNACAVVRPRHRLCLRLQRTIALC